MTEVDMSDPEVQCARPGVAGQVLGNREMDGGARDLAVRALIRDAIPDDAAAIARVGRVAFAAVHRGLVVPEAIEAVIEQTYSLEALVDCISSCVAAPDAHFLVAESDGQVRGYLHFDCFGPRPELHRIYVVPELTGRGLGAKLLHELERRLEAGTTYVLLVVAGNLGALRFYAREGFREEQRIEGLDFYRRHMGVEFPPGSAPVPSVLLRKTV
jgi:ribosomal protein S18 acetylase RimI-like enzyme